MVTRKEYLSSLNPPLASLGRGRLSATANAEIERAIREDSMTFDDYVDGARIVKTPAVTQSKPRVVSTAAPVTQSDFAAEDIEIPGDTIKAGSYDPAAVRVWAKDNGHDVSERGRVHQTVLRAYKDAHGGVLPKVDDATLDKDRPHATRFRMQDKWVGTDKDGSTITKTWKDCCNRCGYSIGYCGCIGGPLAFGHDTVYQITLEGRVR